MVNINKLFDINSIQFARMLAEINAVGLSDEQLKELTESMNCDLPDILELFERAELEWGALKDMLYEAKETK